MRRRLVVAAAATLGMILVIGTLVWSNQQGFFGHQGKAKRLLGQAKDAIARNELPKAQGDLEELISTFPNSPWTDDALLELGQVYASHQQYVEAKVMFETLLERFPQSLLVVDTQEALGDVNVSLLFSPIVTDEDSLYEVQPGDTLGEIAMRFGTTVEFIRRSNGLKGNTIFPRQRFKVTQGKFGVLVDKSQNSLLLTENDRFVKAYTIATGKNNSTPVGDFTIVNKLIDPVWYTQGAVVPPGSPENILGSRWMGIDQEGYGIHGSVDPDAMGRQVTAGCVRMRNSDVEELFAIIPMGTAVTIVD